jgi:hypothetical protein
MSFTRRELMYLFICIPAKISIAGVGDQKELWEGSGRNAGCSRGGKQIEGEDFHIQMLLNPSHDQTWRNKEKESKAKVVLKRKPAVDSDRSLSRVADPHSFLIPIRIWTTHLEPWTQFFVKFFYFSQKF